MSLRTMLIVCALAGGLASGANAAAPDRDSLGAGWREQQNEARRASFCCSRQPAPSESLSGAAAFAPEARPPARAQTMSMVRKDMRLT